MHKNFDFYFDSSGEFIRIPIYDRYGFKVVEALIDLEDLEEVSAYTWHLDNRGHAVRTANTEMAHTILGVTSKNGPEVHHAKTPFDNRRMNLKVVTKQQHQQLETPGARSGSSLFKGVDWHVANKKWRAGIKIDCKSIHLGYFDDERKAARAYNVAALMFYGKFADLNIIN